MYDLYIFTPFVFHSFSLCSRQCEAGGRSERSGRSCGGVQQPGVGHCLSDILGRR